MRNICLFPSLFRKKYVFFSLKFKMFNNKNVCNFVRYKITIAKRRIFNNACIVGEGATENAQLVASRNSCFKITIIRLMFS